MAFNGGFGLGGRGGFGGRGGGGGGGCGGGNGGERGGPSHSRSTSVPNSDSRSASVPNSDWSDLIQRAAAILGFNSTSNNVGGGTGADANSGCCTDAINDLIQRAAAILGFNSSSNSAGSAGTDADANADTGCCTSAVNGQFSYVDENSLKIEKEISCRNLYLQTISCEHVFQRKGGKNHPKCILYHDKLEKHCGKYRTVGFSWWTKENDEDYCRLLLKQHKLLSHRERLTEGILDLGSKRYRALFDHFCR